MPISSLMIASILCFPSSIQTPQFLPSPTSIAGTKTALTDEEASPTELLFWKTIQASTHSEDYEAYLAKYPNGAFADLAKIRIRRLAGGVKNLPALQITPTEKARSKEIVIGGVAPMTGEAATFGLSCKRGFDLAVDEWNANEGILGKSIRLAMADDKGDPAEGAVVFTHLVHDEQVVGILGPVMSKVSLAGAPICQAAGVPMIAATATNPKVTQVGNFIFRACFIDPFQGIVGAKFSYESLKARKAACLFDVGNDYTRGLSEMFRSTFTDMGGQIVAFEGHATGTTDFQGALKRILATKPDMIYVSDYYNDAALIAKQARKLRFKGPLLGGDGWDSPKLTELAGSAIEGCFFSNHYVPGDPTPRVQSFVEKFKTRYAQDPDAISILGYDSAYLMFDAIKRAGTLNGVAIRDALAATNMTVTTGHITFDPKRNPVKSAVICEIKNGQVVFRTTVDP